MALSKIAKNSFPGILSAGKVLGIVLLLFVGNLSLHFGEEI